MTDRQRQRVIAKVLLFIGYAMLCRVHKKFSNYLMPFRLQREQKQVYLKVVHSDVDLNVKLYDKKYMFITLCFMKGCYSIRSSSLSTDVEITYVFY